MVYSKPLQHIVPPVEGFELTSLRSYNLPQQVGTETFAFLNENGIDDLFDL